MSVQCDIPAWGSGSFLTIEGYSCLSTNSKALIPVNGKFKKHFLISI